ncbi:D-alanine--D-alanine ligase [Nitratiruptor sp. SB155-2]|uniref:D-alanine--D-alanine ligase n=1 Tax=Nitratiruptor sp. (strain SB155-2) TaxID=387092 RepID=DDL_NITSB|nr:D-alanine--D-alanine ligase [Nitratiruptor sp. SB155-2]A6Q3Z7.1 RecName: Full=D-alanine--D-alanine ligase; AltName: Full=D-Ala-D-Ala ligase; AltName: Full=D-alanylalanine synthetase [Nitratiruptor sp. SB155-2]BAF70206.1 D-alanine-D-alanine ligase [Nitratiruptor sp. SB155-2]
MQYAVVFGGKSYEHEISIVSTIAIKDIIPGAIFIFLDGNRDFYLIEKADLKSNYFSSGNYKKSPKLELKKGGFYQKSLLKEKKIPADVVINLVHGADGEDGKLASLLEFFEIDYIGPRIEGSVISYSKLLTKLYAKECGIEVLPYQLLRKQDKKIIDFEYPVIIKPNHLGSSIGVSVVYDSSELEYALDVAFEFDDEVLIEPFIEGIEEYNLAGAKGQTFHFSKIEAVKKEKLLDFEKKYLDFGRSGEVKDASLNETLRLHIRNAFEKIYDPLFSGAIIRIDFFVRDGKLYLNEINPVPGSLANYLFGDFRAVLEDVAKHLPKSKNIVIDYRYINSIQSAKK